MGGFGRMHKNSPCEMMNWGDGILEKRAAYAQTGMGERPLNIQE